MFDAIQLHSHVGTDGSLDLHVDLGRGEERDVVITIQPLPVSYDKQKEDLTWQEIVERTYGSCAGTGFERPDQGVFEERETIE